MRCDPATRCFNHCCLSCCHQVEVARGQLRTQNREAVKGAMAAAAAGSAGGNSTVRARTQYRAMRSLEMHLSIDACPVRMYVSKVCMRVGVLVWCSHMNMHALCMCAAVSCLNATNTWAQTLCGCACERGAAWSGSWSEPLSHCHRRARCGRTRLWLHARYGCCVSSVLCMFVLRSLA